MEVVKEFVVKGYADANFDTIQIILSSRLDSYSRTVIWNSSKYSVVAASTR